MLKLAGLVGIIEEDIIFTLKISVLKDNFSKTKTNR
jgi:hypothetical protein